MSLHLFRAFSISSKVDKNSEIMKEVRLMGLNKDIGSAVTFAHAYCYNNYYCLVNQFPVREHGNINYGFA